jgi:GTP cyclohydrolase I
VAELADDTFFADSVSAVGGVECELRRAVIADATRNLIDAVGEDLERPGLAKTPERVARAWEFLTSGYRLDLSETVNGALFPAESSELVVVRGIAFASVCEHHLLPFFGSVHVGYVPGESILGLSKFARIVELFARRLQVQERLTGEIADALDRILCPEGLGVVVEAQHLCMVMRGVQKQGSVTRTRTFLGTLREGADVRQEFLAAL